MTYCIVDMSHLTQRWITIWLLLNTKSPCIGQSQIVKDKCKPLTLKYMLSLNTNSERVVSEELISTPPVEKVVSEEVTPTPGYHNGTYSL